MTPHKSVQALNFDEQPESPISFLDCCKDLEKSIHELSDAIENRRKNKIARQNLKKD